MSFGMLQGLPRNNGLYLLSAKLFVKKNQLCLEQKQLIREWNQRHTQLSKLLPEVISPILNRACNYQNVRLVCKDFAKAFPIKGDNSPRIYYALSAHCDDDHDVVDFVRRQKIKRPDLSWVSYLYPGSRYTKTDDLLYTSWEDMEKHFSIKDPYIDHGGNSIVKSDGLTSTVVLNAYDVMEDLRVLLRVNKFEREERRITVSLFDRDCRLIAAVMVGDHKNARRILIEHLHNEDRADFGERQKERSRDIVQSAFALAIQTNDIEMLKVFSSVVKDSPQARKFYNVHKILLAIALATNKEPAFKVLSSFVLNGRPQPFIIPCTGRIKIHRAWGRVVDSQKSTAEKTSDMCDAMKELGYNVTKKNVWEKCHFLTGNVQHCITDGFSYQFYLSELASYINVDRQGRKWKANNWLFRLQDSDLEKEMHIPMMQAIENNDLDTVEKIICSVQEMQYCYNQQLKAALLKMHIRWLKAAKYYQKRDAFSTIYAFQPHCEHAIEKYLSQKISDWAYSRDSLQYGESVLYSLWYNLIDKNR